MRKRQNIVSELDDIIERRVGKFSDLDKLTVESSKDPIRLQQDINRELIEIREEFNLRMKKLQKMLWIIVVILLLILFLT